MKNETHPVVDNKMARKIIPCYNRILNICKILLDQIESNLSSDVLDENLERKLKIIVGKNYGIVDAICKLSSTIIKLQSSPVCKIDEFNNGKNNNDIGNISLADVRILRRIINDDKAIEYVCRQ